MVGWDLMENINKFIEIIRDVVEKLTDTLMWKITMIYIFLIMEQTQNDGILRI